LGALIRKSRNDKDLTQQQLASQIGEKPQTVSHWEKGIRQPNASQLLAIWRVLRVSVHQLDAVSPDTVGTYEDGYGKAVQDLRARIAEVFDRQAQSAEKSGPDFQVREIHSTTSKGSLPAAEPQHAAYPKHDPNNVPAKPLTPVAKNATEVLRLGPVVRHRSELVAAKAAASAVNTGELVVIGTAHGRTTIICQIVGLSAGDLAWPGQYVEARHTPVSRIELLPANALVLVVLPDGSAYFKRRRDETDQLENIADRTEWPADPATDLSQAKYHEVVATIYDPKHVAHITGNA
jgi:transcriptional regulator with XRE-family HTH domain